MFCNWIYCTAISSSLATFSINLNSDITKRSLCFLETRRRRRRRKQKQYHISTRNRGAQSNKSDSIDGIFQVNEASKMAGNITNDGSTNTDHGNGNNKAWVSIGNSCVTGIIEQLCTLSCILNFFNPWES